MTISDDVSSLMEKYWQWLRDTTEQFEINDRCVTIITPFLDHHNDNYQILTLNASLMDSPYLTTRLLYSKLNRVLIKPSTFEVTKGSMNDLFAIPNPKEFLDSKPIDPEEKDDSIEVNGKKKVDPFIWFDSDEEYERYRAKHNSKY